MTIRDSYLLFLVTGWRWCFMLPTVAGVSFVAGLFVCSL